MHRHRLAVLTAGFAALAALPGFAAEPASGAITDATPTIEWTGGPYVVPNITPAIGDPVPVVCEEGTPTCDVFRFEVNLPSANQDEDSVVVTVAWEDAIPDEGNPAANTPDYDLYLYDDESGDLILTQASAANPEIINLGVAPRKYRLVVIPFAAMNVPYQGKVAYVPFEEDKTLGIFGGALPAGVLLLLAGLAFARLARR